MRVTRLEVPAPFRSFSLNILFEEQRDVELFHALLVKMENQVKPAGLYDIIISKLQEGLR